MRNLSLLLLFLLGQALAAVDPGMPPLAADAAALTEDLRLIVAEAGLRPGVLRLEISTGKEPRSRVVCTGKDVVLRVEAPPEERAGAFYHGLRRLGFLFPHPRWQISPNEKTLRAGCGKAYLWRPLLRYRGFHLHTLHPNEWVHAFFMGRGDIAQSYVRWLARNGQNVFQLALLRLPLSKIQRGLEGPFRLAKSLGVHPGVSLGAALQQQKSYKLIPFWRAITGIGAESALKDNLNRLLDRLDVDFFTLEAGTSEFTSTNYEETLRWLNLAAEIARARGRPFFTKVHVSTNQRHDKWGNYNFLPAHASPAVGVLPHTVMFYGLLDPAAPMYGNKDFSGIREFMRAENAKRPTWYYPETGYWVGMDVDIPLFLTDYLRTRAEDLRWLNQQGVEGQITFSTGHGLGGWLFDWNLALLTDADLGHDPLAGVKLLGEDPKLWQAFLDHQAKWFKGAGLIAELSSANIQDEVSALHRIHKRDLLRELARDPALLRGRLGPLHQALKEFPAEEGVKHPELRALLRITRLRLAQALALREALAGEKRTQVAHSKALRAEALRAMAPLRHSPLNFPDARAFEKHENPTSYPYGYLWTAGTLHFWRREEAMVEDGSYFPFRMNIYNAWRILF